MTRSIQLLFLALTGCRIEPCEPGQTLDKQVGACLPSSNGTGGQAAVGGTGQTGGSLAGGAGGEGIGECSPSSKFGDACAADAECLCPTNYCVKQPGQAQGLCTHTGCIEDPSVCPADFQCLDLSMFDPALPSVCVPAN